MGAHWDRRANWRGALGLTQAAEISGISVQAACYNKQTPVCVDAEAEGLL